MPLELVTEAPKKEDFTPLSEHQSQTPSTFFGARPVLHHHSPEAKLTVRKSEYEQHDILSQIHSPPDTEAEEVVLNVDVWITSKYIYPQGCSARDQVANICAQNRGPVLTDNFERNRH